MTKLTLEVLVNGKPLTVTAKPAQTLQELIRRGKKGVTALEMSNTWAVRLASYVYDLRHLFGLEIEMQREEHDGGWHARYFLITPVQIIA